MRLFDYLHKARLLGNTIPLISITFATFIIILLVLSMNYYRHVVELESIIITSENESHKMQLLSELMELSRSRTRLTSQIIDTEDVFKKDELNLELETYAGRFAQFRSELLTHDMSDKEQVILKSHESIIPIILPAQRKVVELAMTDDPANLEQAKELLYTVVLPGQGQMVDSLREMISLEQRRIAELTESSKHSIAGMQRNSGILLSVIFTVILIMSFVVIGRIRRIQNNLIHTNETMEQQVSERTEELRTARDELLRYIDIVDKYVIISHTDPKGMISSVSEAFCTHSKYTEDELLNHPHNIIRHPDTPDSLYRSLWASIAQGKPWRGEIKNLAKDGSSFWLDVNIEPEYDQHRQISGYTSICQDITDKKRIEELSVTDQLTQLYNRLKLDDVLEQEINRANRYNRDLSLILFDIDRFKNINDSFGHPVGDAVLLDISDITRDSVRNTDIAGRWGGEEFMIICLETDLQGATELAERIRRAIAGFDFPTVGHCSSSFGVATYQQNEGKKSLLHRADAALYRAKRSGRDRVEISEPNPMVANGMGNTRP